MKILDYFLATDWVRELGVKDPAVSPTHAWRHTFKQRAARNGIAENVHDEITGHAPASEGRGGSNGPNGAKRATTGPGRRSGLGPSKTP